MMTPGDHVDFNAAKTKLKTCLPTGKPAIRLAGKSQGQQTISEYEE